MTTYHKFSDEAVSNAIDAAKTDMSLRAADVGGHVRGEMQLLAECISVTVEDNKICIDLPLGLGKHCISIPVNVPNGTAAQACLKICTTFGIPTGVEVSVIVAGVTIVSQKFGKC